MQWEVDWGNEDLTKRGYSESESGTGQDGEPHTLEIINICTLSSETMKTIYALLAPLDITARIIIFKINHASHCSTTLNVVIREEMDVATNRGALVDHSPHWRELASAQQPLHTLEPTSSHL